MNIITDKQLLALELCFQGSDLRITRDEFLQILRRIRLSETVMTLGDRLAFLVEDQPEYRAAAFQMQDAVGRYWYDVDPEEDVGPSHPTAQDLF